MATPPPFASYSGMVMAAPMVRISVLGFRTFAARCGSDVLFSEELVAAKLVKCVRESRPVPTWMLEKTPGAEDAANDNTSGTWDAPFESFIALPAGSELVEYVHYEQWGKGGGHKRAVVFSTLRVPDEHRARIPFPEGRPVILQMGVADAAIGAQAAALLCNDVDGFDLNMGCPKKFSVSNGMGASLMAEPDRAAAILSAIRAAIGPVKPLSFKTRIFENVDDSVAQLSKCLSTGAVHTVTLHARFRSQRSESKPQLQTASDVARRIKELFPHIAVIYNGSLGCSGLDGGGDVGVSENPGDGWGGREAILATVRALGFDGGLVARDAMWNPTVLMARGHYSSNYVAVHRRLLEYHSSCGTSMAFLKYHITRTFGQAALQNEDKLRYKALLNAKSIRDFAMAFGMSEDDAAVLTERQKWFGDGDDVVATGADSDATAAAVVPPKREQETGADGALNQPPRPQPAAECAA